MTVRSKPEHKASPPIAGTSYFGSIVGLAIVLTPASDVEVFISFYLFSAGGRVQGLLHARQALCTELCSDLEIEGSG